MAETIRAVIDGCDISVRTWEDLLEFTDSELAIWQAFGPVPNEEDPWQGLTRLTNALASYRANLPVWRSNGMSLVDALNNLTTFVYPHGEGLLSESDVGQRVLSVASSVGSGGASFAYSFERRWLALNNVQSRKQFEALLVLAQPHREPVGQISRDLRLERAKLRSQMREHTAKLGEALERTEAEQASREDAARSRIRSWIRRQAVLWGRRRSAQQKAAEQSIADLHSTKAAFVEFMRLKAPADYWKEKAKAHKRAEGVLVWVVGLFFVAAIASLSFAFYQAALRLLQAPEGLPTAVYFVASAGLATVAGLVFWIGRLLNRLYLSEHHLRKDAEEREVMMTTYLALTHDQAADEKDRAIILAALFRNTSDGIVKDDGGIDPNLASILSKVVMGRPA